MKPKDKDKPRTRIHIERKGRTFCGRDVTSKLQVQNEDLPVPGNVCSICLENLSAIRVVRMA